MYSNARKVGRNEIYAIEETEGMCTMLAGCPLHPNAVIRFTVPLAAAREWFERGASRPPVQELFPDLSAELRELLVTGTSPAEWDSIFGGPMPETEEEFVKIYGPRGYTFPDA